MLTADYWIDSNTFTDFGAFYAFTYCINDAKEFMTNDARIFCKRIMLTINMAIWTTNFGKFYFYLYFTRWRGGYFTFDNC